MIAQALYQNKDKQSPNALATDNLTYVIARRVSDNAISRECPTGVGTLSARNDKTRKQSVTNHINECTVLTG